MARKKIQPAEPAETGDIEDAVEDVVAKSMEIEPHSIRRGRPAKYRPEFAEQAAKLCKLAATDAQLADFFDVDVRTIPRWAAQYPEFCHALKLGKEVADARVERSLYQRAVGYEVEAVKITAPQYGSPKVIKYREVVQPDVTACIFWLKNRKKDEWRDKQEVEHSGSVDVKAVWAALAERGKARAHASQPAEAAA